MMFNKAIIQKKKLTPEQRERNKKRDNLPPHQYWQTWNGKNNGNYRVMPTATLDEPSRDYFDDPIDNRALLYEKGGYMLNFHEEEGVLDYSPNRPRGPKRKYITGTNYKSGA